MNKVRLYFYPKLDYRELRSKNSYVLDLENVLNKNVEVVNKSNNSKGVLDFFKFLFKVDAYLFNWIEDLPIYRFGKIQVLVFLIFTCLSKMRGVKFVWILHNKYSHDFGENRWTNLMFSWMMKYSDLIITHSSAGVAFGKEQYPKHARKIKYLPHPVKESLLLGSESNANTKKRYNYDFLFWGTILPYKGILKFLKSDIGF